MRRSPIAWILLAILGLALALPTKKVEKKSIKDIFNIKAIEPVDQHLENHESIQREDEASSSEQLSNLNADRAKKHAHSSAHVNKHGSAHTIPHVTIPVKPQPPNSNENPCVGSTTFCVEIQHQDCPPPPPPPPPTQPISKPCPPPPPCETTYETFYYQPPGEILYVPTSSCAHHTFNVGPAGAGSMSIHGMMPFTAPVGGAATGSMSVGGGSIIPMGSMPVGPVQPAVAPEAPEKAGLHAHHAHHLQPGFGKPQGLPVHPGIPVHQKQCPHHPPGVQCNCVQTTAHNEDGTELAGPVVVPTSVQLSTDGTNAEPNSPANNNPIMVPEVPQARFHSQLKMPTLLNYPLPNQMMYQQQIGLNGMEGNLMIPMSSMRYGQVPMIPATPFQNGQVSAGLRFSRVPENHEVAKEKEPKAEKSSEDTKNNSDDKNEKNSRIARFLMPNKDEESNKLEEH